MPRIVDLELLRQMTRDAMRVYEAGVQAQELTAEAQHALDAAEELLRQTALAFVPDDVTIVDEREKSSKSSRETLIAEYVEIQKAHAQFKDALYRLVKAQMKNKEWSEAYNTLRSLRRIDPDYRSTPELEPRLELLKKVSADLKAGRLSSAVNKVVEYLSDEGDTGIHDIVYDAIHRAIEKDAWDSVKAIMESLLDISSKRDIHLLIKEYNLPSVEIRAENMQYKFNDKVDSKVFLGWFDYILKYRVEDLFVVGSGNCKLGNYYYDSGEYSVHVDFPQSGIFCKINLPDGIDYQSIKDKNLLCGLLICRPEETSHQRKSPKAINATSKAKRHDARQTS